MQKKCLFIMIAAFVAFFPSEIHAENPVVINEFSIHPGNGNKEWVEFYNPAGVDLSGYWIDDDTDFNNDSGGSSKKLLENIQPGSDENHFVFELSSSMFNNSGDSVVLLSPDGSVVDQYKYIEDPGSDGIIGRNPDGNGSFQLLASATRGSPNSPPLPPPTSTPAPTLKPTKQPTATKVPTSAKSKTSNHTDSTTETERVSANTITQANTIKKIGSTVAKVATNGAYPTPILGASSSALKKKPTARPTEKLLIKSASDTRIPLTVTAVGVVGIACGILVYFIRRSKKQES